MKVYDLTEPELNWLVASILYPKDTMVKKKSDLDLVSGTYKFTTDWMEGSKLIDQMARQDAFDLGSRKAVKEYERHTCFLRDSDTKYWAAGPTLLLAAARCFVTWKLGENLSVPPGIA